MYLYSALYSCRSSYSISSKLMLMICSGATPFFSRCCWKISKRVDLPQRLMPDTTLMICWSFHRMSQSRYSERLMCSIFGLLAGEILGHSPAKNNKIGMHSNFLQKYEKNWNAFRIVLSPEAGRPTGPRSRHRRCMTRAVVSSGTWPCTTEGRSPFRQWRHCPCRTRSLLQTSIR